MSFAEYINSAQIGEFFWFLASLILLVLTSIKIFLLKENFHFDEKNTTNSTPVTRMGTKGAEYQLTVNNEPVEDRQNAMENRLSEKASARRVTENIPNIEAEAHIMNINQISPNKNSRYYSPNGKELREDLDLGMNNHYKKSS